MFKAAVIIVLMVCPYSAPFDSLVNGISLKSFLVIVMPYSVAIVVLQIILNHFIIVVILRTIYAQCIVPKYVLYND
jgi:hypothetical protein